MSEDGQGLERERDGQSKREGGVKKAQTTSPLPEPLPPRLRDSSCPPGHGRVCNLTLVYITFLAQLD